MSTAQVGYLMARFLLDASLGGRGYLDEDTKLDYYIATATRYAREALRALKVEVAVAGPGVELLRKRNFLMVGNHMSYLDALVISSIQSCVFVTSVDMGEAAVIGKVARLGGSIFVERRHRGRVDADRSAMAEALKKGFNVMIYPEGTSTDGSTVLPFKKGLLTSAIDGHVDILPVVLKYTEIDGEPFSPGNRDSVCWYGERGFVSHLKDLSARKSVKARVELLEPIKAAPETDARNLARQAHEAILASYTDKKANWRT